jgi:hypothetical protein
MKPLNLLPFGRMLQFTNCGPTWNLAGDNKPTRRTSTNKKGTRTLLALALASIVTAGTNKRAALKISYRAKHLPSWPKAVRNATKKVLRPIMMLRST